MEIKEKKYKNRIFAITVLKAVFVAVIIIAILLIKQFDTKNHTVISKYISENLGENIDKEEFLSYFKK